MYSCVPLKSRRNRVTRILRSTPVVALAVLLTSRPSFAQQGNLRLAAGQLLGGAVTTSDINAVATALAQQIATFPVGTTSEGSLIDPATGALTPTSTTSGPFFAERAQTLGAQGMLSVGVSIQTTHFVSFEGRSVSNGDLRTRAGLGGAIVDVDQYTFNVSTRTVIISASYAADDNLDIGVVIPIVDVSLNGTANSIDPRTLLPTARIVDAAASGLGDMVLRGKFYFFRRGGGGVSAVVDAFLPTGSEDRLSGTGRLRLRPMLVASATSHNFSPHVNVGYTFGGPGASLRTATGYLPTVASGAVGDEINFTLGADVTPTADLTVFADVIGRVMQNVARFKEDTGLVQGYPAAIPLLTFAPYVGTLNNSLAAIGARATVFKNGLLSFGLLIPLTDGGLKPSLTPVLGFEYSFR
jgi:hypothetical protein